MAAGLRRPGLLRAAGGDDAATAAVLLRPGTRPLQPDAAQRPARRPRRPAAVPETELRGATDRGAARLPDPSSAVVDRRTVPRESTSDRAVRRQAAAGQSRDPVPARQRPALATVVAP